MATAHAPAVKQSKARKLFVLTPRVFATILIVTGLIGLMASFVLTLDKIHVLKDPSYNPLCNINPIFSCGSVMKSKQAEIAGMPNTIIGLVGFPMVITVAAVLLSGGKMHKRFWQLWMLGMLFGMGGFLYLFIQSVYSLKTLCVYCMSTWAALLPLIWYSLLWNLQEGYITAPKRLQKVVTFMRREHLGILVLVYLIIAMLIVHRFWYFFSTL